MIKDTSWCIEYNQKISDVIYEMKLKTRDFSQWLDFSPGQFVHIRIPNAPQLLLRRPISVHMILPSEQAIVLQYAVIGEGTRALSCLQMGESLLALGPIGQGFPIENRKNIWLLGGGIGIAPLFTAIQKMPNTTFTAFLGWKCKNAVYALERWEDNATVHVYTDDGSFANAGFAIEGMMQQLNNEKPDAVFACGPMPMLRKLGQVWPSNIPCHVSLEERMACGIGACLVCNCAIKTETGIANRRVCVDGPVFPLQEVVFS